MPISAIPSAEPQRRLHRLGQPLADAVSADQAVHDHLDRVLLVAAEIESRAVGELDGLAVDPHPGKALLGEVVEKPLVLALPSSDYRGEDAEPRSLRQIEHPVDDLLGGLPLDGTTAIRAVGPSDPRVEESQVVVDLRDGADGRTGVTARRLLVDRDRRR